MCAAACTAAAAPKLGKHYQDWLNGPPSLLITRNERAVFLNLPTDEDRDTFIDRFWETRNPTPGGAQNEFKEEFYRRVAWANAHFGANSGTDGWRTDMGKTWILFGKPQFSRDYGQDPQLRPIQLWFYANPGLSELPAFFYVLFVDRDDVSGYRLYHPYVDGPARLVRSGPTNAQAYETMREISAELAHASLSLIPGEPVDTETFSGSMASVQIINAIQGYREMPSYEALIAMRAQRLEQVTSRIRYDLPQAGLVTLVVFELGEPWLHWQLELNDPMQPKAAAGRVEYRINSKLFSNERLVFERNENVGFPAPEGTQEALKRRPLLYEDKMPVVPGNYRLAVTAQSAAGGRTYESSKEFTVEPGGRVAVSDVLIVSRHDPDPRPRPFGFAGVKFEPNAAGMTRAPRGLSILYQVHLADPRPAELGVEYVIGSVTGKYRKTFEEKLDPKEADANGSLMIAKTLGIEDVSPGVYQLAVRVKDPENPKLTARSVRFVVSGTEDQPPPIVISRSAANNPKAAAANDYERALCWLAQDRPREAVPLLEASLSATGNPAVRGLLTHLYEQTGQRSRLADFPQATREGK